MKKTKAILCFITIFFIFSMPFTVFADYYWSNGDYQDSPTLFETDNVISKFGAAGRLNAPTDMFIDKNNDIYILDAGNSRIVVINDKYEFVREYKGTYGKDNLPLKGPQGICVTQNSIFIADTENGRIVHIGKDGKFIEEFTQPKEDTYDTKYPFKPNKIIVDNNGIMFIANMFDWHGLITMDGSNKFLGYIATSKIELSLVDKLVRIFATPEQKEQYQRELPPYFSNMTLAPNNFIYGVSYWAKKDQIQKLTPAGTNIYPSGLYGEMNNSKTLNGLPGLVDLAVTSRGFVFAADGVSNKIALYDPEGHNIAMFGWSGNVKKSFQRIVAIGVNSNENVFALDGDSGTIQVFSPTFLMKQTMTAISYTINGEYNKARPYWSSVLEFDKLNYLANVGLAKATYRDGNLKEAMKIYKEQFNKVDYSLVFSDFRVQFFRDNFVLCMILILAIIAGIVFLLSKISRYAKRISVEGMSTDGKLNLKMYGRLSVLMIWHPIDASDKIKQYRTKLKNWPIIAGVLVIIVTLIADIYLVHFPLTTLNVQYVNIWQQIAMFFIPLISWTFVSYALSVISDGKQTLKECLTVTVMCFMPYIVFTYPLALLSQVLSSNDASVFFGVKSIIFLWCCALIFITNMRMNEFSFGKVIWMAIKTVFGILCLWMIIFLFGIIIFQFIKFIQQVYLECSFLFM